MASDTDPSSRKRRRSPPDDVADKSSKQHKHRHHRHHRSHRRKKHGEESKHAVDETALSFPPMNPIATTTNNRRDDYVEEGEILEEEEEVPGGVRVKDIELREEIFCSENLFDRKVNLPKDHMAEVQDGLFPRYELEVCNKRDLGCEYYKSGKKQHAESGFSNGCQKRKSYHDVDTPEGDESKLGDWRKSSASEIGGVKNNTETGSASHDRYHDEVIASSRSLPHDFTGEKSCSRRILEGKVLLKRGRDNGRVENISVDERMSRCDGDLQHDSEDLEREHNASYSRSQRGRDRHRSRDALCREVCREKENWEWRRDQQRERSTDRDQRREKNGKRSMDWDPKREMEQQSKNKDRRREKERERSRDRDIKREKEREWSRDRDVRTEKERERSMDLDVRREMERERTREREMGRDRRREKQQWRSLDREVERDRRRDMEEDLDKRSQKEREKNKDKGVTRSSDIHRDQEKWREKDSDIYKERDRIRDRDWEGERERGRHSDGNRNKARDIKSDLKKLKSDEDEQVDFEGRINLQIAEQEEDLDRIKEESRKCREAILEKYKNQQLQQQNEAQLDDVDKDDDPAQPPVQSLLASTVPETLDTGIDSDIYVAEPSFSVGQLPTQNGGQASERTSVAVGLGEGTPKSERSDERYCDDIFGETPAGVRKLGKEDGLPIIRSGLHDNWDDPDGYYGYRLGEILDGRYEIVAAQGKGVFSMVVRASDLKAGVGEPNEVAIKIIRNNETMQRAGQSEVKILNKLADIDQENKRHCVQFLSCFKYRNHLCLVFESLHMNLREVLKKFGRNIGLKLTAVRAYAKQLFIALKHLKNCGVLHCDIKPDNMLVNEAKNVLKLCDFGNAMFSGKNEITPYLVSRFYRAPEVILGLPYDHPMDMWSVGCCLYELYTGKVLFPGPTNNDMLRLHMELKGSFPKKMLKKGAFVGQHFDQDLHFHAIEEDPVTKKTIKRLILNIKPKDIGSVVTSSSDEDLKMLANFRDLLDKIFVLDPEKRMAVHQAQLHPFITAVYELWTVVAVIEVRGVMFGQEYS